MPQVAMRLTLIDATLKDFAGHNYDYARLVAAAVQRQGRAVRLIGSKAVGIAKGADIAPITPWFAASLKDDPLTAATSWRAKIARLPVAGDLGRRTLRVARRLRVAAQPDEEAAQIAQAMPRLSDYLRLWSELDWGDDEVAFAPNLTWPEALLVAEAAVQRPLPAKRLIVLLRFDPPQSPTAIKRLREAAAFLGDKVAWCSDTQALAAAHAAILGRLVTVAPIPIDDTAIDAAAGCPADPGPHFGYFGEARREKGFHRLPEAIERLPSTEATFTVQYTPGGGPKDFVIERALARLRRLPSARVELIEAALPTNALLRAMARCRVLLLPYASEAYRLRSSGLLCYALALGRVLIVPAGENWLARTVDAEAAADRVVVWRPDEPLLGAMQRAEALASNVPMRRRLLASQAGLDAPWLWP
jgi:glycosyltransferase involved in cell wall biosynthesis